jgi:uncharacterized repeat protein (TIGR02543 family)
VNFKKFRSKSEYSLNVNTLGLLFFILVSLINNSSNLETNKFKSIEIIQSETLENEELDNNQDDDVAEDSESVLGEEPQSSEALFSSFSQQESYIALARDNMNTLVGFKVTSTSSVLPKIEENKGIVFTDNTSQASALFLDKKIAGSESGFSTYFVMDVYKTNSSKPADGFVFLLAGATNELGSTGGGLGYSGILKSIGIEFDFWDNGSEPPVHTTIFTNGAHSAGLNENGAIIDNQFENVWNGKTLDQIVRSYNIWIDYNKTSQEVYLRVSFDGDRPETVTKTFNNISIDNTAGSSYFAGFTAATGGASAKFALSKWYFSTNYLSGSIVPSTINYSEDLTPPSIPELVTTFEESNIKILLSSSDNINTPEELTYQYSFDNVDWLNYSGSILFADDNSKTNIYVKAYDTSGNISEVRTSKIKPLINVNFNNANTTSANILAGDNYNQPTNPSDFQNYSFKGWYTEAGPYLSNQKIYDDLDIFAVWTIDEQEESYLNTALILNDADANYATGSMLISSDVTNAFNNIVIKSSLTPTVLDEISIDSNKVYIGLGDGLKNQIATVSISENGINGNNLRLDFIEPLSQFRNGDFSITTTPTLTYNDNLESSYLDNWTIFNKKFTPTEPVLRGNATNTHFYLDDKVKSNTTYIVTRPTKPDGSTSIILELDGFVVANQPNYGHSSFGPYVESGFFSATELDDIQFSWKAAAGLDRFQVLAYLLIHDENGALLAGASGNKLILNKSGPGSVQDLYNIETISLAGLGINPQSKLKFRFVGGSWDANGYGGLGATFEITNVSVKQKTLPASIVEKIARNITFINNSDNPNTNQIQKINILTSNSASITNNYNLYLNINPVNDPPTHGGTSVLNFSQNQVVNFNFNSNNHFSDPDNSIIFSLVDGALPQTLTLNTNGVISGTLINDDVGTHLFRLRATETTETALFVENDYTINVANVNDKPIANNNVISPSYDAVIGSDNSFVIPTDLFIDIDQDPLEYTLSGVPSGMIYISSTNTLSGTPSGQARAVTVTITAKDPSNEVATRTFVINLVAGRIDLKKVDNTLIQSVTQDAGTNLNLPTPIQTAYDFVGWYNDIGLTSSFTNTVMPASLISLYAKFTPTTYNIVYNNLLNSDNTLNAISTYNIETPTFSFNSPSRIGYNFAGWFSNPNYTGDPITQLVTGTYGDFNIYAKWTPIIYNINYFNLDESLNNPIIYTIETNNNLIEPVSSTGKTFLGFYNNPEFSGDRVTNIPRGTVGNINIYASWFFSVYYLRFYDGENLISEFPLTFNSETLELQPTTDKEGHTFVNWSNEIPAKMPNRSIDIFANYTINEYKLTIKNTLDEEVIEKTITFGEELISHLPVPEEVEGYTLVGFETLAPEKMPATDLELKIVYEVKQFNLILSNSLGETVLEQLIDFNADLSIIDLEPKEIKGYEFDSWSIELPEKMPASDLTLVALYNKLSEFELVFIGIDDVVISTSKFSENQSLSNVVLPNLSNDPRFNFEGWDKNIPDVMPNEKVEIRALGTLRTVELTLLNEDLTVFDTVIANVGQNKTLPKLELLGYNFLGWRFGNSVFNSINAPISDADLIAAFEPKVYVVSVTIGSRDLDIGIAFNQPVGQLPQAALFGYVFEGWKQYIDGPFIDANTTFNDVDNINLVPVFRRLNAVETLIATPGFIIDLILSYFD